MGNRRPVAKNAAALLETAVQTIRASNVLWEDVRSQVHGIAEAVSANTKKLNSLDANVQSLETKMEAGFARLDAKIDTSIASLDAKMDSMEARLSKRIARLEDAIRTHSAEIRELRAEVAGLRHDFDHRAELGRLDSLEARVAAIEARVGIAT